MRRSILSPSLSPWATLGTMVLAACVTTPAGAPVNPALDRDLAAMVASREHPLLNVSALAVRDGRVVYHQQFGRRYLGATADQDRPVTARTLFRVASISKLVVVLGVMRLVEQGRLDLDEDVSRQLGWTLRNPHFPDQPISLRLLLTHRSSLTDGDGHYTFGADVTLRDVLAPGGARYREGLYWRRDRAAGGWFSYTNFNYGVIATVMERATGERFDRLMHRLVLAPLGLRGGFNPAELPAEDRADIATLYRKRRDVGEREFWEPEGPWIVHADDFVSMPPQQPAGIERYVPGSNGTLFGPQGRLRISVADLGVILQMLLDDGRHRGQVFLRPESIRTLEREHWRRSREVPDGENVGACSWGLGVQRYTDRCEGPQRVPDEPPRARGRGDRLVEGGGFTGWGHSGDAYGLMGMFVLDRERRRGMVVIASGPGIDPATFPSQWSSLYRWQEIALTAVYRHVFEGGSG